MGQQLSSNTVLSQQTSRSFSYNVLPSSQRSFSFGLKATKKISVGSVDQLNLMKQMFNFRLKNKQFLTHCYGFEVLNEDQNDDLVKFACKSSSLKINIKFHYQKVTLKFTDLYSIPIEEGLKLLAHSLQGFSILYDYFGYFTPESRLICRQGDEWKVWISDNIFALKNKVQVNNKKRQVQKQKFLQQVVHLFDALRDEEYPDFSYSFFIYGKVKARQFMPNLQLKQILDKLGQSIELQKSNKIQRLSLKRLSSGSNETVRKLDSNALVSFEDRTNQATVSKFKVNRQKGSNKSFSHYNYVNQKSKQNFGEETASQSVWQNQLYPRQRQNSFNSSQLKQNGYKQNVQFSNFKRVSSKLIQETILNQTRQNDYSRHLKNKSCVSTPTNSTGWTRTLTPLKLLSTKLKESGSNVESMFLKRQRSYTTDMSTQIYNIYEQERQQPRKITQNSQTNSESEQNAKNVNNFQEAFLQSTLQIQENKDNENQGPVQIISRNPTSNTPSIAHKTKSHGKQTMKFLKDHLLINSKGEHKRSKTDHAEVQEEQKRIKFCWSQEFDSQFVSLQSKNDNPFASGQSFNDGVNEQKNSEQMNRQETDQKLQTSIKRIKKVKIAQTNQLRQYSQSNKRGSNCYRDKSELQDKGWISKQASIAKLAIFKSQGGFKSLLANNKLGTLKSIKQIEVDMPIDEDILNDLNKMFTKHRFAKSTKQTK